jgi:hypothetical protein
MNLLVKRKQLVLLRSRSTATFLLNELVVESGEQELLEG